MSSVLPYSLLGVGGPWDVELMLGSEGGGILGDGAGRSCGGLGN